MNLREKLENNIVIFFLTTLLTGFLAGIGTYQAILKITGLEVVRRGEQSKLKTPREQALLLTQGHKTIVSGFNIAVKLDAGDKNYDPQNETIQMHFYYPKNPSTKVTELNMNDEQHVVTYIGYWIRPGDRVPVSFGELGSFTLMLRNPRFHEAGKTVRSVEFIIAKNGT